MHTSEGKDGVIEYYLFPSPVCHWQRLAQVGGIFLIFGCLLLIRKAWSDSLMVGWALNVGINSKLVAGVHKNDEASERCEHNSDGIQYPGLLKL